MNKCCDTCKFSSFLRTPTGRIKQGSRGRCWYEVPESVWPIDKLPISMTQAYGFRWPDQKNGVDGSDGKDCPVYEAVE
jgi:hypothetical protein